MAGATATVSTGLAINGSQFCFLRIQDLSQFSYVDPNGQIMCGSLDHYAVRVSTGPEVYRFKVLMAPHPGELDVLLPLMGWNEDSTDTFTPTDTETTFTSLIRRKSSTNTTHSYTGCKIAKAVMRWQYGASPMTLELDIVATGFSEGSTFSPSAITLQGPYTIYHSALTLRATSTAYGQGVIVWDRHMKPRYNNTVAASVYQSVQRTLHLGVETPYTDDEDDILTTFIGASRNSTIAANVNFTNGTKRLIWDIPGVVWEATPPSILNKENDVRMYQFYKALRTAGNPLATVTQDNT